MNQKDAPFHKWWIWITYAVLLLLGVPWYWNPGDTSLLFGMPGWVLVAILVSICVSALTSYLWFTQWREEESEGQSDE